MKDTDKEQFVTIISGLADCFGRKISNFGGFWMGLRDLELRELERGVTEAMKSLKFMPTIVEIREFAGRIEGSARCDQAWMELCQCIRTGPYVHVQFVDKALTATIRAMGGWVAMCDRFAEGESQEKWIRKEFDRIYTGFVRRGVLSTDCGPLCGLSTRLPAEVWIAGDFRGKTRRLGFRAPRGVLASAPPNPTSESPED